MSDNTSKTSKAEKLKSSLSMDVPIELAPEPPG